MYKKNTIDSSNPFRGEEKNLLSINDITSFRSKVVFKSEVGLIVSLPNDDTSILSGSKTEQFENLQLGDDIDVYCDSEGNAYANSNNYALYKNIISKAKNGSTFKAHVVENMNQGLLVMLEGLQCFLPESQISTERHCDLNEYLGKTVDAKVISVKLKEKEGNRFLPIVSHKIIEDEKNIVENKDKIKSLKVGSVVQGTVKSILSYGAFVTIFPTIDGLVHITDMSWERIKNPADIVSVGQKIQVIVLDFNKTKDGKYKISLGMKQLSEKPWSRFDKNSKVGDVVVGTVCKTTDYGIFLMLPSGVQGLIHRTELSWDPKINQKHFQIGQSLSVKIINIDWGNEKLLLSLKQMTSDPWNDIDTRFSLGDVLDVTIQKFVNFGMFVKIDDFFNGFIHVSELSWSEKIKNIGGYFNIGDQFKAKIVAIDKEKKRIELSHKQTIPNPWLEYSINQHVNAIIVNLEKNGIHTKLEHSNLPAFIPISNDLKDHNLEVNDMLECIIQDIDINIHRIILARQ